MLTNYFKIAWRNLLKNKLFSLINILGLGLAIPFALLAMMQVVHVFEYDNFHTNRHRTYRIITNVTDGNGSVTKYASSPVDVAEKLQTDYPALEKTTHVIRDHSWDLNNRIKTLKVNAMFANAGFFDIFDFTFEKGKLPQLPNTIALTHETAELFFGDANAVGKTLAHPKYGELTVTGVLKSYKTNTHLSSDVLVSMATYAAFNKNTLTNTLTGSTYVLLKENALPKNIDAALTSLENTRNKTNTGTSERLHFRKQILSQISPDFEQLKANPGVESLTDLSVNFFMALAIILLACFNYTNLTLARSLSRAKEVGVRKVAGAARYQLITQFICESILVSLLALATGFFVLQFMRGFIHVPWLTWEVDNNFLLWTVFIVFTILLGAMAGFIPARILSGFQPVKVLKGTATPASFGKINFRKSLVVVQFVVTALFIFLIANMYSQFKYMATDNENFNRKNIFNIALNGNYRLLQNDVALHKDVDRVGLVSTPFGGTSANCNIKKESSETGNAASYYAANADFITNMKLQFVAGKNFTQTNADSATNFVVVNEQAIAALGLGTPQQAIGKAIILNNQKQVIIEGVVKNFCYYIYQFAANPLVMQYNPAQFHALSIQTKTAVDEKDFKTSLQLLWKKYYPHEELAFSNYEKDLYDRYYPGADMRFMGLVCFVIFVIAIMGLIGIVTYNTEKRVKEIGIRKVLGASVTSILKTLSGGFVKLILVAAAICIPLGYISGYYFINIFAFNNGVNVSLMIFLFALIFFIALLTIAINALKAATINPVKNLRSE
ncbi:MAG: ABC transporter permease [Bacteroidota bacterium]